MSWAKIAAALLVIIGIVSVPAVTAQTATGEANGTVTDRSGGVVPGATVTLTNQGTKISRTAVTNASGNFVFVNVQPGTYVLKVELTGFKTVDVPPFDIGVNQARTHAIALEVGAMAENVTVVGESPMLQVTSTELGTVIPEKVVHDLPLNGRNFTHS